MSETADWSKYTSRIPWPQAGETHVISREQLLRQDPKNKAKVLIGTDKGTLLSIWPSQLYPIADYFFKHDKAKTVRVTWHLQGNRVVASVEALDSEPLTKSKGTGKSA